MWELSETTDDFYKSGVWLREAKYRDEETALVFHEVKVDETFRRQGIGHGEWTLFLPSTLDLGSNW
jgi:hypothetical protein